MKKLKIDKINKVVINIVIEALFIFLLEIIFKSLRGVLFFDWSLFRILISAFIISGIIVIPTSNLKILPRTIILSIFNLFICLYAWIELGLYEYLGAFMSIGNVSQGAKTTNLIGDFLSSYRTIVFTLFIPFILSIIYLALEDKILKTNYSYKINYKSKWTIFKICGYFISLTILFILSINVKFMQNEYQAVTNKELFEYPSNAVYTINNYGITTYLILDIKGTYFGEVPTVKVNNEIKNINESDQAWIDLINKEDNVTLNNLNYYFINREESEQNEMTGAFKGKNLIMILGESLSFYVLNDEYKEYFPNLYKIYSEGISGVNSYSPKNNCSTGESEMGSVTSIYTLGTACTISNYPNNKYPQALLNVLKNNGYYTSAYHDYNDTYYNRRVVEENYGAQVYYDADDLGILLGNTKYTEWPSDVELIEKALPKFVDNTPFASYMISVTSHFPYILPTKYGDMYLSKFDDLDYSKSVKRYMSKVKVLDDAIGKLLSELEEKEILDDTVIVLFGDHYPYAISDGEYSKFAGLNVKVNQEVDRTPFIIYNSETEARKITKYVSFMDFTPTLLNLFGVEYDSRLYLGNDIFSDNKGYVVYADNSWENEDGFYSASKGKFYRAKGSKITNEEIMKINSEILEKKTISALAIKKDYFNYLYENLERN